MGDSGTKWLGGAKNKFLSLTFIWGLALMVLVGPTVAHAGETELKAEIDRLWVKLADLEAARDVANEAVPGEENWAARVQFSGVVEVEGNFNDGVPGDDTVSESDIALATVELAVDAKISEASAAHVLFLYEDGEELLVDEATITLGNTETQPLYLTAGRMYVPFGNYESRMVSDPLTLEIGETQEDVVQVGVEAAGFYASVYTFKGDTANGGDDLVEHYGANAGFSFESDGASVGGGGGWISSIQDSDGLTAAITEVTGSMVVADYVEGYAAHLLAAFGPVTLIGEYVGAGDDIIATEPNSRIRAFNVEAGVSFPLAGREAGLAVGYQETAEALWAGAPEKRILVAGAIEVMDGATLALEWLSAEDYGPADGGTGSDWEVYTLQLAAEF